MFDDNHHASSSIPVPDTNSTHTNTTGSITSSKRSFMIVESLYIAGFETRTKTDPTNQQDDSTYYVYEIVLENEAVGRWTVWRRYNDFLQLYRDIQKWAELRVKLEGVELRLPSRFTFFIKDLKELAARRAEELQNHFLMPMFEAIGGVDLDFWHHPVIMAFFEVPVIRKNVLVNNTMNRDAPTNDLDALYGDTNSWMEEFRKAEELVERVRQLVERQRRTQAKQVDLLSPPSNTIPTTSKTKTRIVTTNTERVVESAATKLDDLERALDSGTPTETELGIHKQALSRLKRTFTVAVNELSATKSVPTQSKNKLTASKESPKKMTAPTRKQSTPPSTTPKKTDPSTQQQQNKNTDTSKAATISSNLKNQRRQLEVIAHQKAAFQSQDQQLSQISLALRRQKLIANEINNEVDKESSQLDALGRQLDQTRSKLDRNIEKVKKV